MQQPTQNEMVGSEPMRKIIKLEQNFIDDQQQKQQQQQQYQLYQQGTMIPTNTYSIENELGMHNMEEALRCQNISTSEQKPETNKNNFRPNSIGKSTKIISDMSKLPSPPLSASSNSSSPPNNNNNNNQFQQTSMPKPASSNIENQLTNEMQLQATIITSPPSVTTQRRLPIDDSEAIFDLETQFLQLHNVRPYKNIDDDQSTIIYSRALDTYYLWPIDDPLTIDKLSTFKTTGHTLNIAYTKTYSRNFALDLDCVCRKRSMDIISKHLSENLVVQIQNDIIQTFVDILNIKSNSIKISIWRNLCGFHLYTNVYVSMPTHLLLKKIIEVKYQNSEVIFEVPTFMPLPYSAKKINHPYQQVNSGADVDSITFTATVKLTNYIEFFKYFNIPINGFTVATINTVRGDTYFVKLQKAVAVSTIPKVFNVMSISLDPAYSYMKQFESYIVDMVKTVNIESNIIGDINLDAFNVDERSMLRYFMSNFNNKFVNIIMDESQFDIESTTNNYETCKYFIHYSAINHGGLYLQPFTAALYLAMNIPETQFERFRNLLKLLYANVQYKSVETFIKYINLPIYHAYRESNTSESIINHLQYLHKHNVSPIQSINDQINTIACSITSFTEAPSIQDMPKEEYDKYIRETINMFMEIFIEMQLIYYDNISERHYCLSMSTSAHYQSHKKLTENLLPSVLRTWIGNSIHTSKYLTNYLEHSPKIYSDKPLKFTTSPFMFATTVGVFNSITGLYTANCNFLKFTKFRTCSIWNNPIRPPKMYTEQNEDIVHTLEIAKKYSSFMHNNIIELYTHAIIAPAFIQVPHILNVDECKITQLFNLFSHHKNFESMYFLVEYFPIDPKIIYLMMHLCYEYDGIDILLTYHTMVSRIFHYNKVTKQTWQDKFNYVIESASYDDTKSTYMDQLLSLKGCHDYHLDKNTCLFVVLFTTCISKCLSYSEFNEAFNIKVPLQPKNIHPAYNGISNNTNMDTMRENFDRARSIVFGDNLSDFESRLIDECISISMSANFIPETISNILSSIGLTYIPVNIKKKLIVFHGHGDVGKSLLCKKLQDMVGPKVGRFTDLSKVMNRASVSEYTVTIISELNDLVPSEIKSITGNDSESRMRFFSQAYELQEMQSLMYGATNIHVKFRNSNNSRSNDVDRTTINRLYTILLTGAQCPATDSQPNLLTMLVNGQFYMGILQDRPDDSTTSLAWLSFCTYLEYRDKNFHPMLNVASPSSRDYQNTVYYNNSKLYRFLVNSGMVEDKHFYISRNRFLDIIKNNLDKDFPDLTTFKIKFEQQYNICFAKATRIPHFQQSGLINHIWENMAVINDEESLISYSDIFNRVKIYTLEEHRDNALQYFTTVNAKYFDAKTQTYKGVAFQTEGVSYIDNVLEDNIIMNPNSLVVQNV
uniref:Putative dnahel n=1 Tax=Kallithea virus TaxID=1654582 RepID=A0A0F7KNN3_9VIRU|nr:putative dnahel [Kallithea virus]